MCLWRAKLFLKSSDLWFFNYSQSDVSEIVNMDVIICSLGFWVVVDLNTLTVNISNRLP